MKKAIALMSVAALLIVFQACTKKKENQSPVITINEPNDGDMIMITDSLHLEGTATDDESLHEMSVKILNHGGTVVFEDYPYVHELKSYTFHYHKTFSDTGMYHIHVIAEDHDGGNTEVERMIHVQ